MSTSAARIAATEARKASSSVARVEANRRNAQKSTGPKSAEGKLRVSANALKHGLRSDRNPLDLATDTALPFEHEEFARTLAAFQDDLQPTGPLETRLVERLAQIDLRLNRAVRMETTHLDLSARRVLLASAAALPDDQPARNNWLTTLGFLHDPAALKLISQYESRLSRDFARTLTQLRQAQKLRHQASQQELREQTQPDIEPTAGSSFTSEENSVKQTQRPANAQTSTPCHPSHGVVADAHSTAAQNPAEQTQSAFPSPALHPASPSPAHRAA